MAYRVGRPHTHSSEIYCVKSCPADSGSDLLAVGGEVFLEVLRQVLPGVLCSIQSLCEFTMHRIPPQKSLPMFSSAQLISAPESLQLRGRVERVLHSTLLRNGSSSRFVLSRQIDIYLT
jgi:hypothetical protein